MISPFPPLLGGHWLQIKTIRLEGGNLQSDDEKITPVPGGSKEHIAQTTQPNINVPAKHSDLVTAKTSVTKVKICF